MTTRSHCCAGLTILFLAATAPAADLKGWHLIWGDEFNGKTVDPAKWYVEDAALVKNNELQYYAPDDVFLRDGCLVLRSQKRTVGTRDYSSGLVSTRGRFAQAFGRIEIRAKLPKGQGLWPAHWMLPEDGSWPPEIDIMEMVGSQPNNVVMSLHNGQWPDLWTQSMDYMGPDFSAGFHVFALEWEPGEMRWLVDGEVRHSTKQGVPQKPFYLILNTAVGGDMPGEPDDSTPFPQEHVVDYVRVYGRDIPGTCFLVTGAEHGRVAVSPKENRYKIGSAVTLTAISAIGYRFDHWAGDIAGTNNPVLLTMGGHRNVSAVFSIDPDAPVLLSQGKIATASSQQNETCIPQNAVDGNKQTRWSSEFADPQWFIVDLGTSHKIEALRIAWENAYAKDYLVDVSEDGKTWTNIHAKRGGRGNTEEIIGINATGRYVRLTGTARATEWGYSLWEFEVFGR